ncbi:hypothetical protein HY418_02990 [Candidatus Kaiserbacteria bacterium]|nr:hypothetical protein [Candidatus Kaiserbacteria bacterium]
MKFLHNILARLRDLYANRSEPEGARAFAMYFWRALLLAAFVTLVVSISYGERVLYSVLNDLGAAPQTVLPAAPIDRATLNAVVSGLEARQSAYDSLKARSRVAVPDPSR